MALTRILMLTADFAADFSPGSADVGSPQELSREKRSHYLALLAHLYGEAFRGPPWFERSRCAPGCPRNEYCAAEPGAWCKLANRNTSPDEAHSADEVVEGFEGLLDDRAAIIVVELAGEPHEPPRAELGAVFWVTTARELWTTRYDRNPEMLDWLVREFGDLSFVYRDEVFGNTKRVGNLRYYDRLCRAAARSLGHTLLVGRTINGALMHVLCERFEGTVRVLAPISRRVRHNAGVPVACCSSVEAVVPDDRYILVVDVSDDAARA
jgi:hypothetical protein